MRTKGLQPLLEPRGDEGATPGRPEGRTGQGGAARGFAEAVPGACSEPLLATAPPETPDRVAMEAAALLLGAHVIVHSRREMFPAGTCIACEMVASSPHGVIYSPGCDLMHCWYYQPTQMRLGPQEVLCSNLL